MALCGADHDTDDWSDAVFDHVFPLDHGGESLFECRTCHVQMPSFRSYNCYGCRDAKEMRAEHIDEGIRDLRNCVGCHPTGVEDEADAVRRHEGRGGDERGRGRGSGGRGARGM